MNVERAKRIISFMTRNAAHYDNYCFQLFLWYPLPDGSWKLHFGKGRPEDYHLNVWETEALPAMARAWGVEPYDIPNGLGDNAIPTGYVDVEQRNNREYFVLVVPEELPSGWTISKLKSELRCGEEIKKVVPVARRNADLEYVAMLLTALKELQEYRPSQKNYQPTERY